MALRGGPVQAATGGLSLRIVPGRPTGCAAASAPMTDRCLMISVKSDGFKREADRGGRRRDDLGGYGSGRYERTGARATTQRVPKIRVETVRRQGGPEAFGVRIVSTPCHFSGSRPWLLCPCGRRAGVLYQIECGSQKKTPKYRCRTCADLAYPSQNADDLDRALFRVRALRTKLGACPSPLASHPERPKGMHFATFARRRAELMDAEREYWFLLAEYLREGERTVASLLEKSEKSTRRRAARRRRFRARVLAASTPEGEAGSIYDAHE